MRRGLGGDFGERNGADQNSAQILPPLLGRAERALRGVERRGRDQLDLATVPARHPAEKGPLLRRAGHALQELRQRGLVLEVGFLDPGEDQKLRIRRRSAGARDRFIQHGNRRRGAHAPHHASEQVHGVLMGQDARLGVLLNLLRLTPQRGFGAFREHPIGQLPAQSGGDQATQAHDHDRNGARQGKQGRAGRGEVTEPTQPTTEEHADQPGEQQHQGGIAQEFRLDRMPIGQVAEIHLRA